MTTYKLIKVNRRLMIDENTPEFTEVGYDEPMRHMEDDVDVIARRLTLENFDAAEV